MSFRDKIINNVPKVRLENYTTIVASLPKGGKTRLWKEVTERHYDNPNDALLLAFEDGWMSWNIDNIVPLHEEGTDKDLWKVWNYFKTVVTPELIKESKEPNRTKLIGIDTVDRAVDACVAYVLEASKKKFGKQFESLQDISESTNGKLNGWTALYEELRKPFDSLKNAGYGFMVLAWTKEKETTLRDGLKYNSIQLALSNTARKVFETQASLICCLHNEVKVLDKSGEELEQNLKTKGGKEKASNFHTTETMMYFRPSDFIEVAGGRFTELPEKIEYSADNFLEVFKNAVEGQLNKEQKDNTEAIEKQQEEERQEKAEEAVEQLEKIEEEETSPEEIMKEIDSIVSALGQDAKKALAEKLQKETGNMNYRKFVGDAEKLSQVLEIAKEYQ